MTRDELLREAMIFISKVFEDKSTELKLRLDAKMLVNEYVSMFTKETLEY